VAINESPSIDRKRAALLIQDMQNDVMMEGGVWADTGAPQHAKEQNAVENCRRLADACRQAGVPVIHVWYIVEDGARGLKINAPLFEGVKSTGGLVRGSWGAKPAEGLEQQDGDFVVEKMRMNGWQDTTLESLLRGLDRDQVIVTGAWTNMSIEHTARTGADKGYFMIVPEDCCSTMNTDWHNASINFAMQNVAIVTRADAVIRALG
jgi:gluconolactonase